MGIEVWLRLYGATGVIVGLLIFLANDNKENMARLRMQYPALVLWSTLIGLLWPVMVAYILRKELKR